MLSYVFWHWHRPQIEANTYQEYLINFHRTLCANKSTGFHYSSVLLLEQASWLGRVGETYEDWHVVEKSAALDALNERAVTGACRAPHDQVARETQGSAAGLYQLVFGDAHLPFVHVAYRFDKPAGMSYVALDGLLQSLVEDAKGNLWRRQMNLGPGPEFCLHCAQEIALPANLQALKIPVKQIWIGKE
jgi:hypothetical protein